MADIPDTNDPKVAMLAIAWQMVREIYGSHFHDNSNSETVKTMTNQVLKIYMALANLKPINGAPMLAKVDLEPEYQKVG